jgi:hypothetical protein
MRGIVRLSIAAGVVAASAGAALALSLVIVNSYASFRESPTMDVTHTWTIQGGDKGKTQFAIQDGTCFFGLAAGAQLDCRALRTAPTPATVSVAFGLAQLAHKSHTKYEYKAGANSARPRYPGPTPTQILAIQDGIVGPIVREEDPSATPTYHPVAGTVSLTRGATSLTGRSQRGLSSYDIDIVSNYRGKIVGGPNDGRTVRGSIVVKARGLPRKP